MQPQTNFLMQQDYHFKHFPTIKYTFMEEIFQQENGKNTFFANSDLADPKLKQEFILL